MTAKTVLAELLNCGIEPAVAANGNGIAVPVGVLTDTQRAAILAHKTELIELLLESSRITHELMQAAMRACDAHGDGPEAREAMRADVLGTPPELRPGLLDHFRENYE